MYQNEKHMAVSKVIITMLQTLHTLRNTYYLFVSRIHTDLPYQ